MMHPVANLASAINRADIVITRNYLSIVDKVTLHLSALVISKVVFPIFLAIELLAIRIPVALVKSIFIITCYAYFPLFLTITGALICFGATRVNLREALGIFANGCNQHLPDIQNLAKLTWGIALSILPRPWGNYDDISQYFIRPPAVQAGGTNWRFGINVHALQRDQSTEKAISTFYETQTKPTPQEIEMAYAEFRTFINVDDPKKAKQANQALYGPRPHYSGFGPLVEANDPYMNIDGKEFIARLWIFSNSIRDAKDQINAKKAMVSALTECFDGYGGLVCMQGKTQRLMIAVVQGRIEGINIEQHDIGNIVSSNVKITKEQAISQFFEVPRRQAIEDYLELKKEADQFCKENNRVDRDEFLAEILEFAKTSELENLPRTWGQFIGQMFRR